MDISLSSPPSSSTASAASATHIILEGSIKILDEKRKWKTRWTMIQKLSPIANCLQMIMYKSFKEKLKNFPPKSIFELEHYLGIESGFHCEKESNTIALILRNRIILLAFETREILNQWQSKLQEHFGREQHFAVNIVSVPNPSKSENGNLKILNNISNTNNANHSSVGSNQKLICGPARLLLKNYEFCLIRGTAPRLSFQHWIIKQLRRFGVIDLKFCFEGGSQCGDGTGFYILYTNLANELLKSFELASNGRLEDRFHNPINGDDYDERRNDFLSDSTYRTLNRKQSSITTIATTLTNASGSDSSAGADSIGSQLVSSYDDSSSFCSNQMVNQNTLIDCKNSIVSSGEEIQNNRFDQCNHWCHHTSFTDLNETRCKSNSNLSKRLCHHHHLHNHCDCLQSPCDDDDHQQRFHQHHHSCCSNPINLTGTIKPNRISKYSFNSNTISRFSNLKFELMKSHQDPIIDHNSPHHQHLHPQCVPYFGNGNEINHKTIKSDCFDEIKSDPKLIENDIAINSNYQNIAKIEIHTQKCECFDGLTNCREPKLSNDQFEIPQQQLQQQQNHRCKCEINNGTGYGSILTNKLSSKWSSMERNSILDHEQCTQASASKLKCLSSDEKDRNVTFKDHTYQKIKKLSTPATTTKATTNIDPSLMNNYDIPKNICLVNQFKAADLFENTPFQSHPTSTLSIDEKNPDVIATDLNNSIYNNNNNLNNDDCPFHHCAVYHSLTKPMKDYDPKHFESMKCFVNASVNGSVKKSKESLHNGNDHRSTNSMKRFDSEKNSIFNDNIDDDDCQTSKNIGCCQFALNVVRDVDQHCASNESNGSQNHHCQHNKLNGFSFITTINSTNNNHNSFDLCLSQSASNVMPLYENLCFNCFGELHDTHNDSTRALENGVQHQVEVSDIEINHSKNNGTDENNQSMDSEEKRKNPEQQKTKREEIQIEGDSDGCQIVERNTDRCSFVTLKESSNCDLNRNEEIITLTNVNHHSEGDGPLQNLKNLINQTNSIEISSFDSFKSLSITNLDENLVGVWNHSIDSTLAKRLMRSNFKIIDIKEFLSNKKRTKIEFPHYLNHIKTKSLENLVI
ncbi:Ankyrin-2 [Sarcoptes scabiei]|nr:Ankyrin-2 [Sarcoptes scabiei]